MSDPPPSSTPSAPESLFFHYPDGQQILVFVEAGGILNRPRLIRNLKKYGAVICTDPKNAQVILVDAESWQGKEFIREWGMDQNKVVVDYHWVAKSISAGRALLADDDWGGSKTRDDGLPILRPSTNGDGDEVAPKKTPRETPMDVHMASSKRRKVSAPYSERLPIDKSLPRISTSPSPLESVQASTPHLPLYAPIQPQQQSQSTPTFSPTMSDVTSVFAQQQQAPPTVPFGMSNAIMPGFNMMPFGPQMLAMFAQQQQQTATLPIGTQPPAIMPQIQENFTTALVDIMKMYGAMPGGASVSPWPMLPNATAQTLQRMPLSAGGSSGSGTVVREDSPASFGGKVPALPSLSSPIPESVSPTILSPSIKRKRKSDVVDTQSDQDSSETDNDYGLPLSASSEASKWAGEKQLARRQVADVRKARRTSLQNAAPQRSSHGQSSKPSSSSNPFNKLFVHSNGKPMQFFVQVDQNNRQEITRAIKKMGGMITSQILGADYAVLYTLSTTFKNLLTDAAVSGIPAVTHHFVLDAINQNSIPDKLNKYLFDTNQVSATRKKKYSSAAEAEKKRLEKNAKQAERTKQKMDMKYNYVTRSASPDSHTSANRIASTSASAIKGEKSTAATVSSQILKGKDSAKEPQRTSTLTPVRKRKSSVGANTSGLTSTPVTSGKVKKPKPNYYPKEKTPPPPTRLETYSMGYLYTQEEKEWVEKYLFILFKRDPNMSQTGVAKALYRYLPHHTTSSWSTFLITGFKAEYEEARKRGGISHRKEKTRWETEQQEKARLAEEHAKENEKEKGESGIKKKDRQQQEWAQEKQLEDQTMDLNALGAAGKKPGEEPVLPMQASELSHVTTTAVGITELTSGNKQALTPDEEEDVNTVVQFFLDGGDQGEAEDVVWAKLANQNPCKSMSEWLEFYNQHDEAIVARFRAACSQKTSN